MSLPHGLQLRLYPDPFLKQPTFPMSLGDIVSPETQQLVQRMAAAVRDFKGYALAAPQIGVASSFFVLDTDSPELQSGGELYHAPTTETRPSSQLSPKPLPRALFNPVITQRYELSRFKESCLSMPGVSAWNQRYLSCTVAYRDSHGGNQILACQGTLAVVVQHECDHLSGSLFIEQLSPYERNRVQPRLNKLRRR